MHLKLTALAALVVGVAGHGSMISPAPRSAHGQKYDARNKCDCHKTGGCYSNITTGAQYCGVGCLGESCLYYQIGCYAGCGTCSMSGKGLYPSPEDLQLAGNCEPAKPSLPEHMRSYNVDNQSTAGDWTKVNPWRAPGSAGIGNPKFQPCGVNSGWDTPHPSRGSAGPPAGGQPIGAYGTDLPPVGAPAVWKSGGIEEVSYSIYANHGGGYSYRLCKQTPSGTPTEECFQKTPLAFATDTTTIVYADGSRQPFNISARTTSEGTYPAGSEWRLNPIPMCSCDQGAYCQTKQEASEPAVSPAAFHRQLKEAVQGKTCKAVTKGQCGTTVGTNTCLKCGSGDKYDCEECCPGCFQVSRGGFKYCTCGKKPKPSPPNPNGANQYTPYDITHFRPGQTSKICPSGLMFNSSWDEGVGSGPNPAANGYGGIPYSMHDMVKVPAVMGRYTLSWRWDCEQTPQVWNSCADVVIM